MSVAEESATTTFETLNTFYPPNDKEDFELTRTEFENFKGALKDEQFRKLLVEYVEDVQDPENQKTYQSEVRQLEEEKGNIVHFLNPIPGYVLKTSVNGEKKGFINICSNPLIRKATAEKATKEDKNGCLWSIPFAQSPAREDLDKAKAYCLVYDVIFHPNSVLMAEKNAQFCDKIEEIALDAVEKSFNVKLDRINVKKPNLQYKGAPRATIIKYKIGDALPSIVDPEAIKNEIPPQSFKNVKNGMGAKCNKSVGTSENLDNKSEKHLNKLEKKNCQESTAPRYSLKYRSHVDLQDCCIDNQRSGLSSKPIPDEVILTIDLPLLSDSSTLDADVLEDGWNFELKSSGKACYELKLKLPFKVIPESAKAKFEKDARKLHIVMKTIQVKKSVEIVRQQSDEIDIDVFESETEPYQEKKKLIEEIEEKPGDKDVGYESTTESNENIPIPTVINGNIVVKSILKGSNNSSRCRSMSESWLEHMDHLKYDFESLESLSESSEVLTTSESGGQNEKSVRFSDQVQRQLYRSNSSILGQRKKNQKKNKNKRKNRERHSSEGEASSYDDHGPLQREDQPGCMSSGSEEDCMHSKKKNKKQKPIKSMSLE